MAATLDNDENLKYLLLIMKHTELSKPNYSAVAEEAGINTPSNAQRRFKSLVEKGGYLLLNDKVIPADGTTVTPKKTRAKKGEKGTTPASNKKRKIKEATMDDADEDGNVVKDQVSGEVADNGGEDQV